MQSTSGITPEHINELAAFIAVAEACWRSENPSYSWHMLDWRSYQMRIRYPIVPREEFRVFNFNRVT